MNLSVELTLEQQFNLRIYREQIENLSQDEAQTYLVEVLRQLMIKDNVIKQLLVSNMFEQL
ncbi:MAG: phycobilisome degradation protein nblA [Calothrix sp. SM1_7_51]|nr:phycobilisome degradation protein nblA [Calothrix sp. SM1_7_51]